MRKSRPVLASCSGFLPASRDMDPPYPRTVFLPARLPACLCSSALSFALTLRKHTPHMQLTFPAPCSCSASPSIAVATLSCVPKCHGHHPELSFLLPRPLSPFLLPCRKRSRSPLRHRHRFRSRHRVRVRSHEVSPWACHCSGRSDRLRSHQHNVVVEFSSISHNTTHHHFVLRSQSFSRLHSER